MIKGIINNIPKDIKRVAMPIGGMDKGWEVRDSQDHLIWGRQETISGSTPLSFTSGNGDTISSWSLLGNGQQTGTPTPGNPITPDFCGKLMDTDWTIPITCAGQTVPIYLGQTQTVRRIKKLVLTGTESWAVDTSAYQATLRLPITAGSRTIFSTHYKGAVLAVTGNAWINTPLTTLFIMDSVHTTGITAFRQFLSDQYAAGTPVTVWYVIKTPTTGIVNEPLCKIGNYSDELHSEDAGVVIPTVRGKNTLTIDTTLQPSSMTISGHIK